MFVLGIDPGISRCGYCVLPLATGGRPVALGVITTAPADPLPRRLAELQGEIRALVAEHRPSVLAIERLLFQVNVRTAMAVGQASGVVIAEAASAGSDVVEYSPNQVKQAVAGWGGASKEQMQHMVQTLLGLPEVPNPPDVADAAAVALCHLAMTPLAAAASRTTGIAGATRAAR
jgi:crossover junction endodeoxyribonuclease RuvC